MGTYIALLHSIVIAPGKRVVMADLRDMASSLGYRNPRTLVSTGNIIFETPESPIGEIEAKLEAAFPRKVRQADRYHCSNRHELAAAGAI